MHEWRNSFIYVVKFAKAGYLGHFLKMRTSEKCTTEICRCIWIKHRRILTQGTLPLVDLQIFNVNANACTKFLKQLHFNPVNKISLHEFKEVPISLISKYTSQTLDSVLGILKSKWKVETNKLNIGGYFISHDFIFIISSRVIH